MYDPAQDDEEGLFDARSDVLSVITRLATTRSLDQILTVVSQGVRQALQADGASFVLRDGDRCFYADEDAVSPLWKGRRFPMSSCISGWCMSHREPVAIPDIDQDVRIPIEAYRPTFVRSLAMAPVGRDQPLGALGAYWAERRRPTPTELESLQAIADQAAIAIVRVRGLPAEPASEQGASPPTTAPHATASAASDRPSLRALFDRARRKTQPNSLLAYVFAVLCVVGATLVREAVDATGAQGLASFSTYYPAVLLAAMVGGRRPGVLAAALGGLAAYYFFMPPEREFAPLRTTDLLNLFLYGGSSALIVWIIDRYQRAIRRLRHEDARHLTLAREQAHRVRNALAVVEAIVHQSLRGEPERAKVINQRIRSGLVGVDLGDGDGPAPVTVRELLTAELQAYDLSRFILTNDSDTVVARNAQGLLTLAVHELATNAVKYGSLSLPEGRVSIGWCVADGVATVDWRESGGPVVRPPQKRGYGSVLLRRLVEAAGGALRMEFPPSGVAAEISVPLNAT